MWQTSVKENSCTWGLDMPSYRLGSGVNSFITSLDSQSVSLYHYGQHTKLDVLSLTQKAVLQRML